MGNTRALYNVPEHFKYYHQDGPYLFIGRGMERRLLAYLEKNGIHIHLEYQVSREQPRRAFVAEIPSRPYQVGDAEQIIKHKGGVVRLGTGYGKTVIACQIIRALNRRTLIIVPRTHLVKQFEGEIKKWFNFRAGIIQGQRAEDLDISIASIQTLVRNPGLVSDLNKRFGLVIVDECHGSITDKQLDVIQTFCPEYLYGLTATPRRTDKQGDAIFFTFGDIVIDKDLPRATPEVQIIPFHGHIMLDEYASMIGQQIADPERNLLIINAILHEHQAGRKILVLTKRVEHYTTLANVLRRQVAGRKQLRVHEISSQTNAADRARILEALRGGSQDFDVILGTYSMLATGTDVPALDTLIFAGDLRSDVLQEQSAGRILRIFGDKERPRIIDVADVGNKILANQARERQRFYSHMGWL
jgi:superfamily II DNA or RNA helicase